MLLVPEDRRLHGLVLPKSVGFNLSLPNLDRLGSRLGVRSPRARPSCTAPGSTGCA